MKRIYLIFLFSSCMSLILFSFIDYKRDKLIYKENINNTEKLIKDSITPSCTYNLYDSLNSSNNNLKELEIKIPNSRKWYRNQLNALKNNNKIILDKYKKRFNSKILIKNSSNEICILPAKIRISGDWKDHIQLIDGDVRSSLDVSLKEGNINGITKFKLFLPVTRRGASEVFITLLLKEMGYLSPRTKILDVNINNKSYKMIFQEKATKEMLEHNKLRESAILESDESLLWETRQKEGNESNGNIFPKVVNRKWIKKNLINQKIGLEGAQQLSKAILESWNQGGIDKEITFSDNYLSNGNIKNKKILTLFKIHLIASNSDHALVNHNRKFYYDPINKSLLPIYYDGNSEIRNLKKLSNVREYISSKYYKEANLLRDIEPEDINLAINEINRINLSKFLFKLNSSGVKIDEWELIKIRNQLIKNLIYLKKENIVNLQPKFKHNPLLRKVHNQINYGLVFNSNNHNNFYFCKIRNNECIKKNLNELELNKLLSGKYVEEKIKYYFIGNKFDPINKIYNKVTSGESNFFNPEKDIFIRKFGNPEIILNQQKKLIQIKVKNFNEKVLFINSQLNDWNIEVFANQINNFKMNKSRIDTNLLTSLVTIKDSQINNLKIYVEGGKHEDSLNIINTSGSIDRIEIKNSFQDAIDFDFSNLKVNEIYVNKAGNDCIDLSQGNYFIKNLVTYDCKDKGISLGEKSALKVEKANIKKANIAFVSKDSSKLIIDNAILENNNYCIAAYNKKQEFGPSYISVPTKLCPEDKFIIQNLSVLQML